MENKRVDVALHEFRLQFYSVTFERNSKNVEIIKGLKKMVFNLSELYAVPKRANIFVNTHASYLINFTIK